MRNIVAPVNNYAPAYKSEQRQEKKSAARKMCEKEQTEKREAEEGR